MSLPQPRRWRIIRKSIGGWDEAKRRSLPPVEVWRRDCCWGVGFVELLMFPVGWTLGRKCERRGPILDQRCDRCDPHKNDCPKARKAIREVRWRAWAWTESACGYAGASGADIFTCQTQAKQFADGILKEGGYGLVAAQQQLDVAELHPARGDRDGDRVVDVVRPVLVAAG